jgi:hypothetical protein
LSAGFNAGAAYVALCLCLHYVCTSGLFDGFVLQFSHHEPFNAVCVRLRGRELNAAAQKGAYLLD